MAVARGGSSKPKKPRLVASDSKKTTIQREEKNPNVKVVSQGSVRATPAPNPVGEALTTVGKVVGETVSKGKSKTAQQILKGGISKGEMKNQDPQVIREAQQRARIQERRENRQERREDRRDRREDRRDKPRRDTSKATSGAGLTSGGGGGGKAGGGRRSTQDGSRTGGGFAGKREYETYGKGSFAEKTGAVRFLPLPGGGEGGGGGGGGGTASTSLAGTQGTDVETLLGAKKGKRQRKRRRTE